ncbi:hypothetical protein [Adonisia turfae]|uniref:Uncharacterized protein n=1 Tax=Adonisia turfae CCMR0081 TaxID=2292702 RepID=A0A6M0RH60_9CYAN|nr:hypothetical protein [Adonisia turfae]NEZ55525.1 hypothetical protein [Adonisia turfae CCMR0081]
MMCVKSDPHHCDKFLAINLWNRLIASMEWFYVKANGYPVGAGLVPTLGQEATAKQGNHKGLPLRILLFF